MLLLYPLFWLLSGVICGIGTYLFLEVPKILYTLIPIIFAVLNRKNHFSLLFCIGCVIGFSRISYKIYSLHYPQPTFTSFEGEIVRLTKSYSSNKYKALIQLKDTNYYIKSNLDYSQNLAQNNYIFGEIDLYGIPDPCLPEAKDIRYKEFFARVISHGTITSYVTSPSTKKSFVHKIEDQIQNHFPYIESTLLRSLVLGKSYTMPQSIRNAFQDANLAHLLAISGLHISLVASCFYLFFRWIVCFAIFRYVSIPLVSLAKLFSVIGVISYFSLIETAFSSIRSVIMFLFPLLCYFSSKKNLASHSFMSAVLLILLIWPEALLYPGFQFSCLAVFSLMNFRFNIKNYFVSILASTFVCLITMAPFSIYWVNKFPIQPFLANLICIPLMFVIMFLIIIWLFLCRINISLMILNKLLSFCLGFMIDITVVLKDLFNHTMIFHQIHYMTLAFWMLGLILLLHHKKQIKYLSILCALPFLFNILNKPKNMFVISRSGEVALLENGNLYAQNETFTTSCWAQTLGAKLIINDIVSEHFTTIKRNNRIQEINFHNGVKISKMRMNKGSCKVRK